MGLQTYKKLWQKLPVQISKHDFGSSSFEDCQNQLSQNIHVLKIARAVSLFGVLPSVLFILALSAEDIDIIRYDFTNILQAALTLTQKVFFTAFMRLQCGFVIFVESKLVHTLLVKCW